MAAGVAVDAGKDGGGALSSLLAIVRVAALDEALDRLRLANGSGLASNYSVTQPTGLTASITPRALLVTATETNKRMGRNFPVRIYCCHF